MKGLGDECLAGTEALAKSYWDLLDAKKPEVLDALKAARKEYESEMAALKETFKTEIQTLLNDTIHDIKEFTVEGELNEAGLPTEELKVTLDEKITIRLEDWVTDSDQCVIDFQNDVADLEKEYDNEDGIDPDGKF